MGVNHVTIGVSTGVARESSGKTVEVSAATLEAHLAIVARYIEGRTERTLDRVQASCKLLKELLTPATRMSDADKFLERLDSPEWKEFMNPPQAVPTIASTPWAPKGW